MTPLGAHTIVSNKISESQTFSTLKECIAQSKSPVKDGVTVREKLVVWTWRLLSQLSGVSEDSPKEIIPELSLKD